MAGRIVVGVDGTDVSAAALRWASEEAELRKAEIVAVHAWSFVAPVTPADSGLVPLAWSNNVEAVDAARQAAERIAHDQVRDVLGDRGRVSVSVVQAEAVEALVEAAQGADLLVVGNRGRGALAEALFGSTSGRVSDRAPCPVVVVRETAA